MLLHPKDTHGAKPKPYCTYILPPHQLHQRLRRQSYHTHHGYLLATYGSKRQPANTPRLLRTISSQMSVGDPAHSSTGISPRNFSGDLTQECHHSTAFPTTLQCPSTITHHQHAQNKRPPPSNRAEQPFNLLHTLNASTMMSFLPLLRQYINRTCIPSR